MGITWHSKFGGALFIVDCDGRTLAARQMGTLYKFGEWVMLPGLPGPAMFVEDQVGSGTGYRESRLSLLYLDRDQIRSLWERPIFRQGGRGDETCLPRMCVTDEFRWHWSSGSQRLTVLGFRTVLKAAGKDGAETFSAKLLPSEAFCWNVRRQMMLACRPAVE